MLTTAFMRAPYFSSSATTSLGRKNAGGVTSLEVIKPLLLVPYEKRRRRVALPTIRL